MTAAAGIPSDMVELLTFPSGIRTMDHLTECLALRIHVDSGQVVALFIIVIRLNRDDVEKLFTRTVLHSP